MKSVLMATSSVDILDQVLTPFTECLTPEVAQKIAEMRAEPAIQARLDNLAEKSNEGRLSSEERFEYEKYLEAFHLITILQSKARQLLREQSVR